MTIAHNRAYVKHPTMALLMLLVTPVAVIAESKFLSFVQRLALLCFLVITQPLWAAEIQRLDVVYKEGVYLLNFEAYLDGQFDKVYTLLTDYENLHRLNDDLLESTILSESSNGIYRFRFIARTCVLIFCFKKTLVADVEEVSKGEFNVTDLPELSDFSLGQGTWRLAPIDNQQTRIRFEGEVQPDFWIPPFIGSALIRHKIKKLSIKSMQQIEHLVT